MVQIVRQQSGKVQAQVQPVDCLHAVVLAASRTARMWESERGLKLYSSRHQLFSCTPPTTNPTTPLGISCGANLIAHIQFCVVRLLVNLNYPPRVVLAPGLSIQIRGNRYEPNSSIFGLFRSSAIGLIMTISFHLNRRTAPHLICLWFLPH